MVEQTAQRAGHETRDINVRVVMWFAIGLIVAAVIIHFALGAIFAFFSKAHPSPESPSRIVVQPRIVAPEPRLQTNPSVDLAQFREARRKQTQQLRLGRQAGWHRSHSHRARHGFNRAARIASRAGRAVTTAAVKHPNRCGRKSCPRQTMKNCLIKARAVCSPSAGFGQNPQAQVAAHAGLEQKLNSSVPLARAFSG